MTLSASKTYSLLTTQPFTDVLNAALPTGVGRYFEYGRDGIEPDMKCVPLQWRDVVLAALRAGREISSGEVQYPDLSLAEQWLAGRTINREGFVSSGGMIRKHGSSPNVRAILIDGIIATSIVGCPDIRFPDDVRWVAEYELQAIAERVRYLRKYQAKPQNARAENFHVAASNAKKMPVGTRLRTLADEGDGALLRYWFGHRYSAAVLQTRVDVGFDANGTRATKWQWLPSVPSTIRQLPVLYGNDYVKKTRYLLTPIEDAMLLKLSAIDASAFQVWDISE